MRFSVDNRMSMLLVVSNLKKKNYGNEIIYINECEKT